MATRHGGRIDGDADMLDRAIDALDPVVALLSLVQITGDRALLREYGPALDGTQTRLREAFVAFDDGPESKAAADDVTAEVRDRLRQAVQSGQPAMMPAIDLPLFREMARLALGTEIPEMSVEPAYQHAGFARDTRVRKPAEVPPADFRVLVVGAGMMGINAAVKLQQAGFEYTVLERLDAVGGNWLENTYPGAAVDTPSRIYSFSFEPNAAWTRFYPTGPEFLSYLTRVADRYAINRRIRFGTHVQSAQWDDERQIWQVTAIRDGQVEVHEANALIMAVGPNNAPNFPQVENLDRFAGPVIHSAQWDHSVDLAGKRVVLVGTGCSGVQIATALADRVGELVIVQRQAEHILPNPAAHDAVDPLEIWQMEHIPFVVQWKRLQSLSSALSDMHGMVMRDEEHSRKTGGFGPINDGIAAMCRSYLESHFDDPAMRDLLWPDFPVFAKRPILDCGFYDTLKKPDVRIVRGAMAATDETGVILADGSRIDCDAIVLATGYKLHFGRQFAIVGREGRALAEVFEPWPFSYEGMLVPGFPNFVFMGAPYSYLVANHAVVSEQQVHYTIELLQWMVDDHLASVDVSAEATRRFVEEMDAGLANTAWVMCGNAHGYYRDKGKKVILAVPRHNSHTWHLTRSPRQADFTVRRAADAAPPQPRAMPVLTI